MIDLKGLCGAAAVGVPPLPHKDKIVCLSSLELNAVLNLHVPRRKCRSNTMDDTTMWEGRLPESGDYRIEVGPAWDNATYSLEVTIED